MGVDGVSIQSNGSNAKLDNVPRESSHHPSSVQRSGSVTREEQTKPSEPRVNTREELRKAVEDLNKASGVVNKRLHFQLHEDAGRMMVQVVNSETQEVVREIPPERVLEVVARIKDTIGLLLDERA